MTYLNHEPALIGATPILSEGAEMILVFGSINVDLTVPVPHLPQPGETVLGGDYALLPGGKGANQALAARRAGAEVMLAGATGRDQFATRALDLLRRDGVDTRLIRSVERPTGCAAIIVSGNGENAIAVAPGANFDVRSDWVPDELIDANTILLTQMEVSLAETEAMIRRVRQRGGRCLLNLAPALPIDFALLSLVDLLIANEPEAASLATDPASVGRQLRRGIVVTRGALGASVFLTDGARLDVPALGIDPVDTTGAGDTFVGVLAAGLDLGCSLESALLRASAAAGLACQAHGAQTAMPDAASIAAAVRGLTPSRS